MQGSVKLRKGLIAALEISLWHLATSTKRYSDIASMDQVEERAVLQSSF